MLGIIFKIVYNSFCLMGKFWRVFVVIDVITVVVVFYEGLKGFGGGIIVVRGVGR